MKLCRMKGKSMEQCQNYIRVLKLAEPNELLVCGTNAYKPLCRKYAIAVSVRKPRHKPPAGGEGAETMIPAAPGLAKRAIFALKGKSPAAGRRSPVPSSFSRSLARCLLAGRSFQRRQSGGQLGEKFNYVLGRDRYRWPVVSLAPANLWPLSGPVSGSLGEQTPRQVSGPDRTGPDWTVARCAGLARGGIYTLSSAGSYLDGQLALSRRASDEMEPRQRD